MKAVTIYDHLAGQNAMQAIETMGNAMAKSGMFGITKVEQGTVLALHAFCTGKSIVELASEYHIIEGRLTMRADAMQAKFQANGGRIVWEKSNTTECIAIFSHPEYAPGGVEICVTLKELIDSGVAVGSGNKIKANYQRSPRQMLRARAISEGVRMVDPGTIVGVYTPEEVLDFEQPQRFPTRECVPPTSPLLPAKQLDYTDHINPEDEDAALAFLRFHGWLSAEQELSDLTQEHLKNIGGKPEAFLTEAYKLKAEQEEVVE